MSNTRTLPKFVIVMSGDVMPSARQLAHKFEIQASPGDYHIRQFSSFKTTDNHAYLGLGKSNPSDDSYLFLGHASQPTFGNLSAKEFVAEFKKSIEAPKLDKVTNIYMIGCEMGLPAADDKVLAQKSLMSLQNKDFPKLYGCTPFLRQILTYLKTQPCMLKLLIEVEWLQRQKMNTQ